MPNVFPAHGNVGINTTAPKKALEVQHGAGRFDQLANPASLTYSIAGPTGGTVYTYAVLGKDYNGNRTMAPTIVVNDGPSTLSPNNHITISSGAVPDALTYDVLKLVSNAWMLVGSTSVITPPFTSLTDSGGPTFAYTPPTHNETGHLQWAPSPRVTLVPPYHSQCLTTACLAATLLESTTRRISSNLSIVTISALASIVRQPAEAVGTIPNVFLSPSAPDRFHEFALDLDPIGCEMCLAMTVRADGDDIVYRIGTPLSHSDHVMGLQVALASGG